MTDSDELDVLLDELARQGEDSDSLNIEPAYENVGDWSADWLLPTVERRVAEGSRGGVYWCAQWWAHPEGLQRIYALWREWEKARASDAMSSWWRDHLDPHLATLTGENGAFVQCSPSKHYAPSVLVAAPVPAEVLAMMPEVHMQPSTVR